MRKKKTLNKQNKQRFNQPKSKHSLRNKAKKKKSNKILTYLVEHLNNKLKIKRREVKNSKNKNN